MATKYAKLMKAQGSERFLSANGRRFVIGFDRKRRVLSEVLSSGDGYIESFLGYWRGLPTRGFYHLDSAGINRRSAMRERDDFRRRVFLRRALEALQSSREAREACEREERMMFAEAA